MPGNVKGERLLDLRRPSKLESLSLAKCQESLAGSQSAGRSQRLETNDNIVGI